jgi:asparagine synthase (glutamine-hydrolysing)
MSAVSAIYNLDKRPAARNEMQRVLDSLKHRGEDAQGIWVERNIALGHRMRWVTPESLREKLPLKSAESASVITCDARIDNRDELIPQLSFSNRRSDEISDSEIILRAYEKWGEDCLPRLIGDFVFAIWDAKNQKLVCARDALGVKHFYYYYKPGKTFALASEIKGLLCLPEIPRELNETNIGDILILNFEDKENTPYKEIKRLPATNVLIVDENNLEIRRYWQPKPLDKKNLRSNKDYEEEFKALFTKAVTSRLRSAYPVGTELSGGLDSSSITAVASRHLEKSGKPPLETFSAIFPSIAAIDSRIDERKYVQSIVDACRCEPNYVEADSFSPFKDMDKLQRHADHPIGAPNVFMDWALYEAAKEKNVRVLLSGFDGDSTVSYGYEALYHLARRGRWIRLVKDAVALNKNMPHRHHGFKRLVWKQGIRTAIPESAFQTWRVLCGRPRKSQKTLSLPYISNYNYKAVNSDFADKLNLKNRYFDLRAKNQPENVSDIDAHWNGLTSGLFAFALETFEKASAAFGVEPRYPFFDRRLIEFCIALPPEQRLYNGWTRSIFRRAMNGILPPEVQWRTDKANIGLSFKVNMLKYSRAQVEESIYASPNVLEKYINLDALAEAYEKYQADSLKCDGEAMFILSNVYLSNWLRRSFMRSDAKCAA